MERTELEVNKQWSGGSGVHCCHPNLSSSMWSSLQTLTHIRTVHTLKPPRDTEVRVAMLFHAAPWKSSATDAWIHAEKITAAQQSKTTAIKVPTDTFKRVSVSSPLGAHVTTQRTRMLIHWPLSKTHTIHLYFPAHHTHTVSVHSQNWSALITHTSLTLGVLQMMRVCSAWINTFLSMSNVFPLMCSLQGFALQVILTKLNSPSVVYMIQSLLSTIIRNTHARYMSPDSFSINAWDDMLFFFWSRASCQFKYFFSSSVNYKEGKLWVMIFPSRIGEDVLSV